MENFNLYCAICKFVPFTKSIESFERVKLIVASLYGVFISCKRASYSFYYEIKEKSRTETELYNQIQFSVMLYGPTFASSLWKFPKHHRRECSPVVTIPLGIGVVLTHLLEIRRWSKVVRYWNFSFIVGELVQINPDNSVAECEITPPLKSPNVDFPNFFLIDNNVDVLYIQFIFQNESDWQIMKYTTTTLLLIYCFYLPVTAHIWTEPSF